MNFTQLVNQAYPSLTATERRLADYLASHAAEATRMTVRELSAASGVSASAVVRFAHGLGFEKYSQLVVAIASSGALSDAPGAREADVRALSQAAYAAALETAVQAAVRQTLRLLLEGDDVARAARLLKNADMTYLYGVGSSGVIAQELLQKMTLLGKPCFFQSDSYLSAAGARHIGPRDVAVGISYSGRNQIVLEAVENARRQGAPVVCITRAGSRLSRLADVCLRLSPVTDVGEKGENLSRYAQSIVLDLIYHALQTAPADPHAQAL